MPSLPLESSLFDTIGGLPLHPLVVHAVVMLIPISALGLIAIYLVPRWRRPYGWLTLAALAGGAGAAVVAMESGEALAARVGLPAGHEQLARILVPVVLVTFVVAAAWFWMQRRAAVKGSPSPVATIVGAVASLLAVGALVLVTLVGHSGATAAWADRIGAGAGSAPSASSSATAAGPASSSARSFTMEDVRQHVSAASCWAAIDNQVYDLTAWISQHPGGPQRIEGLCGTDATAAFHGQHGSQSRPAEALARFLLGPLS